MKPKPKSKRGPEPNRLKLRGDWESLVGKALEKKRPEGGWPDPKPLYQTKKSKKK